METWFFFLSAFRPPNSSDFPIFPVISKKEASIEKSEKNWNIVAFCGENYKLLKCMEASGLMQ